METLLDLLRNFRTLAGEQHLLSGVETTPFVVTDPQQMRIELAAGAVAQLFVVHPAPSHAELQIVLQQDAQLTLVELFTDEAFAEVVIDQAAGSQCRVTVLQLSSANLSCRVNLNGEHAQSVFGGAFVLAAKEHAVLKLHTAHQVPDCTSNSTIRGVAGGEATGEFCGLVYVAPDAQRTDARQSSRNMLLSEQAHITTQPQLEIYADDVKCTHGATVGQLDTEAILYMRQRGLSAMQARRLQIEGFVADVIGHAGVESLQEPLVELVAAKLEKL